MKLIIAGSRGINLTYKQVQEYVCDKVTANGINEVVCGGARGVDNAGKRYGQYYGITVKEFPADWEKYGKRAGHIRNAKMAVYADALLLIWDGSSPGSRNMKEQMLKLKKPIYEVILRSEDEKKG